MDPGIYLTKLLNEYLPNQFLSHVLTTSILLILLNSIIKLLNSIIKLLNSIIKLLNSTKNTAQFSHCSY